MISLRRGAVYQNIQGRRTHKKFKNVFGTLRRRAKLKSPINYSEAELEQLYRASYRKWMPDQAVWQGLPEMTLRKGEQRVAR